jgi:undecaprenyl-diphosphatase
MVAAAFYAFVAYLGWRLLKGWVRVVVCLALSSLVLLIGLSRIYLEAHYVTDIVAGYTAGFLWTEAVILGGRLLGRRNRSDAEDHSTSAPDGAAHVSRSVESIDTA